MIEQLLTVQMHRTGVGYLHRERLVPEIIWLKSGGKLRRTIFESMHVPCPMLEWTIEL